MKKFVLFVVFLCALCANGQTVTVTADLKSITGAVSVNDVARVQICFTLVAGDGSVPQDPRIIGTGIVVPFKNKCFTPADGSVNTGTGHFSTNIIANDQISQSGVTGGTMWSVSIGYQGSYAWGGVYIFNLADVTENLNSKVSAVVSPFVTATPTDAVYARLDAGNMPFTAAIRSPGFTNTGSETIAGTLGVTGAETAASLNLNSTGTLSTTAQSGTGSLCMTTSCVMITPTLGAASATTLTVSGASALTGGFKTFPFLKGDAASNYMLQLGDQGAGFNSQTIGVQFEQWMQPTVNITASNFGLVSELLIPIGNTKTFTTGAQIGSYGTFSHFGSGALTIGYGGSFEGFNPGPATATVVGGVNATANNGGVITGLPFANQTPTNNGTATNLRAFDGLSKNWSSGVVTNAVNFYAEGVQNVGGGTITNAIGLDVANISGASNNYAIRTGTGQVQFGDVISTTTGTVGVGLAAQTGVGLIVFAPTLTGANQMGIQSAVQTTSAATAEGLGGAFRADLPNVSFTQNLNTGIHINAPTKGAAATIGEWNGIRVDAGPTASTKFAIKTIGTETSQFGGQIQTTIATGTAPLIVASTTPVANLTAVPLAYDHSGNQLTAYHLVEDSCVLGTSCAVTLTGSAVYTSSTSYTCNCQDETAIASCKVAQASGSAFTITGTGTDTVRYHCGGN